MKLQTFMGPIKPWADALERILSGWVEFGHPSHPLVDSTTLAGDNTALDAHNGLRDNVAGSWVEVEVTALDTPVVCNHNLGVSISAIDANDDPQPNVCWLLARFQHDGEELDLWEDLRVPASAGQKGATNPPGFAQFKDDGAVSTGVFLNWFDADAEEELFFTVQLPHAWKQETDIEVHVHWTPEANGAAGELVQWGLEYTWANRSDIFQDTSTLTGNTHVPADNPLVADTHYVTELGDILATGDASEGEASSMMVCRVYRDATDVTDTYGDAAGGAKLDAGLLEIDFHYQINSRGSIEEDDKDDPELAEGVVSACFRRLNAVAVTAADAVTEDSIELRFHSLRRLVDATHPLKATLFFIPAVRG